MRSLFTNLYIVERSKHDNCYKLNEWESQQQYLPLVHKNDVQRVGIYGMNSCGIMYAWVSIKLHSLITKCFLRKETAKELVGFICKQIPRERKDKFLIINSYPTVHGPVE